MLLLRFVGTLVAGVAVGAPLSHNDTLVGSASPWACVVSNLLTRGTPGKEVKKHREEQVKDLGNRQVLCVCVCVCVCVSCSVGSDSLQPHGLQEILQARI